VPADAVIPALVAYFDIVAVKTLVVDIEGRGEAREGLTTGLRESVAPARRPPLGLVSLNARRCIHLPRQPPTRSQISTSAAGFRAEHSLVYFEKISVFKAGNVFARMPKHGILKVRFGSASDGRGGNSSCGPLARGALPRLRLA